MRRELPDETIMKTSLRFGSTRPVCALDPWTQPSTDMTPDTTDLELLQSAGQVPLTYDEIHRLSVLSGAPVSAHTLRCIIHDAFKKIRKKFVVHP